MPHERPNAFDVDKDGLIRHVEYVLAGRQEPDCDAALAVLKELVS